MIVTSITVKRNFRVDDFQHREVTMTANYLEGEDVMERGRELVKMVEVLAIQGAANEVQNTTTTTENVKEFAPQKETKKAKNPKQVPEKEVVKPVTLEETFEEEDDEEEVEEVKPSKAAKGKSAKGVILYDRNVASHKETLRELFNELQPSWATTNKEACVKASHNLVGEPMASGVNSKGNLDLLPEFKNKVKELIGV